MLPDYYERLNLSPDASSEQVRTACRRARRSHTDAGGNSEQFRLLQEACRVLSDPTRRRRYDAERAAALRPTVAEPLMPREPSGSLRFHGDSSRREEWDRLFQEFDGYLERLEDELLGSLWRRNE